MIHLGPFTSEVRHALSRISDRLLGLIPNFSNITHIFVCGKRDEDFIRQAEREEEVFAHHVGIIMVRFRPPGPNNSHISSPQKEKETGLMLRLLCLRPGDELGPPQATQEGHPSAGQWMLSPKEDALCKNIPAALAASPLPASLPAGNYPLPCYTS